jgi:glycosyltransferase involved in cell wall biosynthesis
MHKVMRILNRFNVGGPVYNASYLSADLAPEFETRLYGGALAAGEASALHIPIGLGLSPIEVPHMERNIRLKNDRLAYLWLRQEMRNHRPHIVHTHASKAGAIGRLAALHERVPVIVHTFHGHVFHSYFGRMTSLTYQNVERYLAKKSSAIVVISERQKYEICTQYKVAPADKTHVIPLGFDLNRFTLNKELRRKRFRDGFGWTDEEFVVGIIGRLVEVKNHALFLRMAAELKNRSGARTRFVMIGDGELHSHLVQLARELGLTVAETVYPNVQSTDADIIFTSWITAIDEVLPGIDAVVLSSHNEGTPVSLIEAQAAGIPVVSTDVGGVHDVVAHNATGFVVQSDNLEAFINAVDRLRNDSALRQQFAQNAPDHVLERFGRSRLARDMRRLYLDLL